ncbi:MAG: ATP-binding protein [Candidatus Falkowbacteria bacterium]
MKLGKSIIWVFLIIGLAGGLVVFWLWQNYQTRRSEIIATELNQTANQYASTINSYRLVSRTIYDEVVNTSEVLGLLKSSRNASTSTQSLIRTELYQRFLPVYERLRLKNFKQLSVYDPEGIGFLNMYKPEDVGDQSAAKRLSIQIACKQGKYVEGFEEGKTFNGFRYIFPLSDQTVGLGCLETSVSFSTFQHEMGGIFPSTFQFILKKDIISDQVFSGDARTFQISDLSQDYFLESEPDAAKQVTSVLPEQVKQINQQLKNTARLQMEQGKEFAEDVSVANSNFVVLFLPINNIAGQQVAYLVAYHPLDSIYLLRNDFYLRAVFTISLLIILLFLTYYIYEGQQKLLGAGERLKNITAAMNEGLMVINNKREIIFYNSAAEEMSGFKAEEAIGHALGSGLKFVYETGNKANGQFIEDVFKKNTTVVNSTDVYLLQKNGERLPVLISAAPLSSQKGEVTGCIVVFRDMTREREVDKAKTEFVSLASHQLKTPLSAINWYAEMMLDGDAGPLNARQTDFLHEIANGNQRMVKLVNSLLNVSRIDMGTLSVMPEPVDLAELTSSVITEQQFALDAKKQTLERVFDPSLPKINLDVNLMRIVMQNLVSNAIKYTREEGHIEVELKKKDDKNAYIRVSDNGYGIPKQQQPEIFKKLFRANNIKSRKVEGTGLGLYVAKAVIDAFGGKIWFDSAEDKGTTFHILLPLAGIKKKEGTKGLEENT